ncbi:MAG TPA: flagellar hook-length control protein FliK [Marinospirillum sp.]|uniref:flagellar hook-length control protein FliK n=1 Tax=Marinospirillum sp. TaxID=2183934 RepID=UPI002B47DCF1|nr:flagellar hook-length control protein FliK [Marinospirillum sp.]HKM16414.1 flagellar hook-length control protein FliK [Marinospirillum sp.]
MQGLPPAPSSVNETSSLARTQSTTFIASTEGGRPALASGQTSNAQVLTSESLPQGKGHRIQVQLSSGERVNLMAEKALPEGQQIQLTGRSEGVVEVKVLSPAALQQAANTALSQLPIIKVTLPSGQTPPIPAGQASRAEVLASQPAANGQGYNLRLQLSSGQQVNLTSNTPLPVASQVHLSHSSKGDLEVRIPNREVQQLLDQIKIPLTAVPSLVSKPVTTTANSLQTMLASASAQLRHALPRQAPLAQAMQQLTKLVSQLTPLNSSTATAATTTTPTAAVNTTATAAVNTSDKLLITVTEKLSAILNLVPQSNQTPSATSLQQLIPFSGLLLEANLLRGVQTNPAGGDLKLLLQQASSLLREGLANPSNAAPKQQLLQQLAQQVQSAQSRIQVLQQSSLQSTQAAHDRGQPAQIIQMDLPYSVRGDWFQAQLEIRHWIEEKEAEAALEDMERKTRSWDVQLSFTLEKWGKIHTLLRLKGEQLKADIWVETDTSFTPIKNQAEILAARLRRLGADLEEVACHLGTPPPIARASHHQQIIDTQA